MWAAEGRGHGHLSKEGSQSLQASKLTAPLFLGKADGTWGVGGDQDACISEWLFLQTMVQEILEESFVVKVNYV